MSPKKRNSENTPLPKRWRLKNGAYRYRVPPGLEHLWDGKKEFRLGATLSEAYRTWSERLETTDPINTIDQLMDRYMLEVIPEKATGSQESNLHSIKKLRPVFGKMPPALIEPQHAYKYHDMASKKNGKTVAKHDIQLLRHLLTKAVEWGVIKTNPLLGQVRLPVTLPRDRFVEDWEIEEALSLTPKIKSRAVTLAKLYVRFKLMTGLRRWDILKLKISQIKDDGIHVQPTKTKNTTGKRLIFEWDEEGEMRNLIDDILKLPPRRIGDVCLFTTRQGKSYINNQGKANAFDSLWQRYMNRVIELTNVEDKFQERDLRAKVASDSETLQEASERLGHGTTETTNKVYRRKPLRIKPLIK